MDGLGRQPDRGLDSATRPPRRSWAAEFGPLGVRANTVSPGVTRTPINDGATEELDRLAAGTPAGPTVTPDDVAQAVLWLASDGAALVQGITPPVDGGISSSEPS